MKQKNKSLKTSTKKGAASIYVVVFVTLLFSVITVTFVRVILSNSMNTENNDLSKSAYDAALSGVEDAKRAIEKYALCKKNPNSDAGCNTIISLFEPADENASLDCDMVKSILYGKEQDSTEVVIKEELNNGEIEVEDEAYTCVTVNPSPTDYRSTLTSANPVRVIQLNAADEYNTIEISWHSGSDTTTHWSDEGTGQKFEKGDETIIPAILSAELIYPGNNSSNDDINANINAIPHSTVFLIPDSGGSNSPISAQDLQNNRSQKPEDGGYEPFQVKCNDGTTGNDYRCTKAIKPGTMPKESDADYLVLAIPYGAPDTEFAIQLKKGNETVKFNKAQYEVDSTGRANDVYRRIKTRVEANDNYFPYPEYAIEISGDATDELNKYFYVTKNCQKIDNGVLDTNPGCEDSKYLNK